MRSVIYIVFDPGLPSKMMLHRRFFVPLGVFDICFKRKKTIYTTMKMISWMFYVPCTCTRNSLKAKSKANNRTHVLELLLRLPLLLTFLLCFLFLFDDESKSECAGRAKQVEVDGVRV